MIKQREGGKDSSNFPGKSTLIRMGHLANRLSKFFIGMCLLAILLSLQPRLAYSTAATAGDYFTIDYPRVVLQNINSKMILNPSPLFYLAHHGRRVFCRIREVPSGKVLYSDSLDIHAGSAGTITIKDLRITDRGRANLQVALAGLSQTITTRALPAFFSLLPPLLAILLALLTRQVIVALFFGIWVGVTFMYNYNPLLGFLHTLDEYIVNAIASPDRIAILIFSLVLGGMVGVMSRSGGTQGIVKKLSTLARNARLGQLATWGMGVLIFFDDYANTLIVGNTMRPLADKLRISREKLSYLVDSTAAPVANIAIISTWIGYEISLINQSFGSLGVSDNAYITFIRTIPYNFYPIYSLVFGFLVAYLMRDFGSMYRAEIRTRHSGKVQRDGAIPLADLTGSDLTADDNTPLRWGNAMIPIGVVITAVMLGLVYTGYVRVQEAGTSLAGQGWLQEISIIVGNADSFAVLMWAAFLGSIAAIFLALSQRILKLQEALDAWVRGIRSMVLAAIILTSAWAIGSICQELYTADYMIYLTRQFLSPHWLPMITFLTAALVSFATGTSWGTMAILMPIAIPLAYKFPLATPGIDPSHATNLMLSTTAAVLAGATFGDHCSPISDTTIMSSMASGADHIDHVRTQLPYAVAVAIIAGLFGYIPVGFDISDWWVLLVGFLVIFLVVRFVGKKTE
jgi:Na+/H+ antiporter NhaC